MNNMDINWTSVIPSIVSLIIALTNIIWAYIVYKKTKKHNNLKTLILDYNLKYFYDFFSKIKDNVEKLKNKDITEDNKKNIINALDEYAYDFQQKFIDLFCSVNSEIYEKLKNETDNLIGYLNSQIGDEGINLYVPKEFRSRIAQKISDKESEIIMYLIKSCD